MGIEESKILAQTYRTFPSPLQDGNTTDRVVQADSYGHLKTIPMGHPLYGIMDAGQYFLATNPTPGTGIAGIAGTGAFSDAETLLYVKNNRTPTSSRADDKRIYIDTLRLQPTVAGTNGTNVRYVIKMEPNGTARRGTGGDTITPVNPNCASTESSSAQIVFGAVASASAANARLIGNGLMRSVITVVGDIYTFYFGRSGPANAHAVAGTAIAHLNFDVKGCILGPGDQLLVSIHAASQTVATEYEFELGYWEM